MATPVKTHQISESEQSDSDTTLPPSDTDALDGSQDLFDAVSTETFTASSKHSIQKRASLVKKISETYQKSDGSDAHKDMKYVKPSSSSPPTKLPAYSGISPSGPVYTPSKRRASPTGVHITHDGHASDTRPRCKYGDKCYRKNPSHLKEFYHEGKDSYKRSNQQPEEMKQETEMKTNSSASEAAKGLMKTKSTSVAGRCPVRTESITSPIAKRLKLHGAPEKDKTVVDIVCQFQPLSIFLTKVTGIDNEFNRIGAVNMRDILSPLMGDIQASCQFNYMFDIPWLVKQYPQCCRNKPLLIVHGEKGSEEAEMTREAADFPQISLCRAHLDLMYGTHHTKMMLLLYDCGMRVVIHTANLISGDWYQKTQGVWISPLFPKLPEKDGKQGSKLLGDSATHFKQDLLAYLAAYRAQPLAVWEKHVRQHDMTAACVHIVASVPGRHAGDKKMTWGHLKLRKVLQADGPDSQVVKDWPVLGQFSSIGSLGSSMDQWLCAEWLTSLSQCRGSLSSAIDSSRLMLVYPSKENVRLCLEGFAGGGCLPYSIQTARKQIYLNNFVRQWRAEGRGRTEAIPHIKTYARVSADWTRAAWFLLTSANLSKAAWGTLEKQNSQLMIRSYEMGVLFLPRHFGSLNSFLVGRTAEDVSASDSLVLPFPYDLPPPAYQKGDRIWMWDVPCVDKPDRHGNKYCPRL